MNGYTSEMFKYYFGEAGEADLQQKDDLLQQRKEASDNKTSWGKNKNGLNQQEPVITKRVRARIRKSRRPVKLIKQKGRKLFKEDSFEDALNNMMIQRLINAKQEPSAIKDLKDDVYKSHQTDRLGKTYQDTRQNDIERVENIRKYTLADFEKQTINSYYNFYQRSNEGTPKAFRNISRGFIYKNPNSFEVVAKVVVEQRNEKNFITELYVSERYRGYGLMKELLDVAMNSLNATGAIVDEENLLLLGLLKKRNFEVQTKQKTKLIMYLNDKDRRFNFDPYDEDLHFNYNTNINSLNKTNPVSTYNPLSNQNSTINQVVAQSSNSLPTDIDDEFIGKIHRFKVDNRDDLDRDYDSDDNEWEDETDSEDGKDYIFRNEE